MFLNTISSIRHKPGRSMLLFLLALILTISSIFLNYVYNILNEYYNYFIEKNGFSILVYSSDHSVTSETEWQKLLGIEHVEGFNQSISCSVTPVGFQNIPYQTDGVYSQKPKSNRITLIANRETKFFAAFRNQDMVLREGAYPSDDNPGAMIDSALAQANDLKIGDSISMEDPEASQRFTIPIIGIYRTEHVPKEEDGEHFVYASESHVFCDLNTYSQFLEINDTETYGYIYVDTLNHVDSVIQKILELEPDYQAVNSVSNAIAGDAQISPVTGLKDVIVKLLWMMYALSGILMLLMSLIWIRDHYEEIGIYLVLGRSKARIVASMFIEINVITLPAIFMGVSIGAVFLSQNSSVIQYFTKLTATQFGNQAQLNYAVQKSTGIMSFFGNGVLFLLVAYISIIISGIISVNLNYRTLFSESQK